MASMKMGVDPNPPESSGIAKSDTDAACAADVHLDESLQKKVEAKVESTALEQDPSVV